MSGPYGTVWGRTPAVMAIRGSSGRSEALDYPSPNGGLRHDETPHLGDSMDRDSRKEAVIGFLVCVGPIAAIALWIAHTGPTTDPPAYTTPSEPAFTWTPTPPPSIRESLEPAEQDCGDGTWGTFAECWNRAASAYRHATPTAWPTPTFTVPTLAPPAVTVCSDGSISHSTGRGTCSWHGGIAH